MKHIPLLLVIGFSLSLCNLANKLHGNKSGSGGTNTSSESSESGGATSERAEMTSAQTAALAGGQQVKWDQQGMTFSMPPKWTQFTDESKEFGWSGPGGSDAGHLIVSISPMDDSFPTDVSIKAFYDGAKTRAKQGEVDELKWVEIDGLKGVQFRESTPEKPDGIRRLQWMAYRKYAGQVQLVNVILSSSGKGFPQHQDELYGILYSAKIIH